MNTSVINKTARSARNLSILAVMAGMIATNAQAVGPIDFETAGDLANNFRLNTNVLAVARLSQTGPGAGNDYIQHNNTPFASGGGTIGIYDTTPGDIDATQNTFAGPFSVEFDISGVQASSSFGVFLINPAENAPTRNDNLLALFNLDSTGTTDLIRFFRDGNTPFNDANAGTQVNSVSGSSGLNVSSDLSPVWEHFKLDYSVLLGVPQLTLTVGSLSATSTYSAAHALPANVEVAFRIFDSSATEGTAKIDNFQITLAPEPGSGVLLGIGAMVFLNRIRRQKA